MVVVRGDLDNLQSNIDFFLSITSNNASYDSKTLRDRFFSMFKQEDLQREDNFLMYRERVSDDYAIKEDVEPLLVGEEEEFCLGSFSFADDVVEEYPDDTEVYISDTNGIEFEKTNLEIEEDDEFVSYSSLENENINLEDEKNYSYNEKNNLEKEIINLENENDDYEDDDFIEQPFSEDENINLKNENYFTGSSNEVEEYEEDFGWGSYSDEESYIEDSSIDTNAFSNIDFGSFSEDIEDEEDEEFSGWGNYDNDISDNENIEDNLNS